MHITSSDGSCVILEPDRRDIVTALLGGLGMLARRIFGWRFVLRRLSGPAARASLFTERPCREHQVTLDDRPGR